MSLADQIDALLPQTQCTKCGYEGCRPYADGDCGRRSRDQSVPSGRRSRHRSARAAAASSTAAAESCQRRRATVDGCRHRREPVHRLHAVYPCMPGGRDRRQRKADAFVIASHCTGCDLCLPPCPMDCISMVPVAPARAWTAADRDAARARHDARRERLQRATAPRSVPTRMISEPAPWLPPSRARSSDAVRSQQ